MKISESTLTPKELIHALDTLAGWAGQHLEPLATRAAAEQALHEAPDAGGAAWPALIARAAEPLGLRVWAVSLPERDLHELGRRGGRGDLPILTRERDGAWVPRFIQAAHLSRALEETPTGSDDTRRVVAVLASRAAPLSALGGTHGGHGHDHGHDQGHGHPSPMRRLMGLLREQIPDLWVMVVYAAAVGLLTLVTPVAVQALVNSVAFGTLLQPVVVLTAVVFIGLAFAGLIRALQVHVVEILQRRVFVAVSADLAARLPRVQAAAFDGAHGPELVNRFFDVLTVQKAVASLLLDGVALVLQSAVGMVLLAFYHPVFLAFDVVLLLCIAAVVFLLGRGAARTSIEESRTKYAVAAWLEELARHPDLFRATGGAAFASARTDDLVRRYLGARQGHFRVLFRQIGATLVLQALLSTLLLGLGAYLVIARQLTIGQLVAAELIVSAVVAGLAKFGKHLESLYDLLAAVDKLGHLVDLPLERLDGEVPPAAEGGAAVRLRGVSLSYAGGPEVLRGLDLDLSPGDRVAIVGPGGSGKSALAEVLYGLRPPDGGRIEVDGVDLREIWLPALREQVALVRGGHVFAGTALENVVAGRPDVRPEDARAALRAVGLFEELAALPAGNATALSASGHPLSSSQVLRLSVARALAGRPRVLILDGVLDSLDRHARDVVFAAVTGQQGCTLLLLTGEPALAARCPQVYALRDGALRPGSAAVMEEGA
jgi:ABC-type bacteriocin/lantibiotic exporter with double-glycine peptidase domain